MSDLTQILEERAISYELSGPSAHHTAALLRQAKAEIERLRRLVQCLVDNDPNDDAADGTTVLMVWRKEARAALEPTPGRKMG
jgi:hypothetical protein